jgi:hypothetical protein
MARPVSGQCRLTRRGAVVVPRLAVRPSRRGPTGAAVARPAPARLRRPDRAGGRRRQPYSARRQRMPASGDQAAGSRGREPAIPGPREPRIPCPASSGLTIRIHLTTFCKPARSSVRRDSARVQGQLATATIRAARASVCRRRCILTMPASKVPAANFVQL